MLLYQYACKVAFVQPTSSKLILACVVLQRQASQSRLTLTSVILKLQVQSYVPAQVKSKFIIFHLQITIKKSMIFQIKKVGVFKSDKALVLLNK